MTTAVDVARRALEDLREFAGDAPLERIRAAAAPLEGTRVLHLAVAGRGGRAAQQLHSVLPLLRGLGLEVDWRVLAPSGAAAGVARQLDDGLRGGETAISGEDWNAYRDAWAHLDAAGYDVVVAHDPAGLGAAAAGPDPAPRLIWRCHVDASRPERPAWERARPLAERFDACVFPLVRFAPPGLARVSELQPAIDPLAPRNRDLPVKLAGDALRFLGVDLARPLCCQTGALDPWRDPHEVVDAFRLAKREVPELQLVLAGMPAPDDAEAWQIAGEIAEYASGDEDLHVLTGYAGVGETELNALQRLSRAVLAKSIREEFGLSAAEALWKGTPVVASTQGGLPELVRDGEHGFLADGAERTAARLVELVRDPALSIVLGSAGRAAVRERFLVTRQLEDELRLLHATVQHP